MIPDDIKPNASVCGEQPQRDLIGPCLLLCVAPHDAIDTIKDSFGIVADP